MKSGATVTVLLLAGLLFSGCSGTSDTTTSESVDPQARPTLAADRGAVAGLLIDDIYRPIAGGLVLLQGAGLTATTDDQGQFRFLDVLPGSYVAVVDAPRHEAAPVTVDIVAGQYTELELPARRIFSNDGKLITTEYSIFTACAVSGVMVSTVASCIADSDSYRPGLQSLNFSVDNATYLVAEVRLNQPDNYVWVLRCDDGSSFGCGEYAYVNITKTYGKLVLKRGDNYMDTWQSHTWNNTGKMAALVFFMGQGGDQITPAVQPVGCLLPPVTNPLNGKPAFCRQYYGAGARVAVQGKIIMSLFLGEPTVLIDDYHVLSEEQK